MREKSWKTTAGWVILTEAVGALAGWLARRGIERYQAAAVKPPLSPPAWVFPLAWVALYALMGIGAARVSRTPPSRPRAWGLGLYWAQLAFNFCWTLLFFNAQAYGLALAWLAALWVLILGMALAFYRADPLSGKLQIPYLLWVAFAGYLNAGAWLLR